ncbi:hypothetical protein IVB27_14490 [Bradyrhizobium sp. 197]|nr:hypothetical protein [Bradyrhizobium sp. 197]
MSAMIGAIALLKAPDIFDDLVMIGASPRYINDEEYTGRFRRVHFVPSRANLKQRMDAPFSALRSMTSMQVRISSFVMLSPNSSRNTVLNSASPFKCRLSAWPVACRTVTRLLNMVMRVRFLARDMRPSYCSDRVRPGAYRILIGDLVLAVAPRVRDNAVNMLPNIAQLRL